MVHMQPSTLNPKPFIDVEKKRILVYKLFLIITILYLRTCACVCTCAVMCKLAHFYVLCSCVRACRTGGRTSAQF